MMFQMMNVGLIHFGIDKSTEVKTAATDAKAAIDAATTVAAVTTAKDEGIQAVKDAKVAGKYEGVKPEAGKIENITGSDDAHKEDNPFEATVNNDDFEAALGVTAEDKAAGVTVWLKVEDTSETIPAADKTLIDAKKDNNTIGMYIDVSMFMKVGTEEAERVRELNSKVKISLVVPEDLRKAGRNYKVIRLHDGEAELIDADYDEATFTLSFETDRFSSYALAYADKPTIPQTGVADYKGYVLAVMMSAIGAMAVVTMKRKKKEEQ